MGMHPVKSFNLWEIYGMHAHVRQKGLTNGQGVSKWYTGAIFSGVFLC